MLRHWSLGLAAAAFLAGCAGGAARSVPPAPAAHAVAPAAKQNTTFTIHIPAPPSATALARRPAYISYSTKSLQINVDPGTPSEHDQSFDLTVQSGNCVASGLLGVLTCTLSLSIAPGNHTVNLIAYDLTGGTAGGGNALSAIYGFPLTIVAGATNTPTFTLGGITASFVIVPLDTTAAKGDGVTTPISFTSAAATQFLVEALDADKNPIIGPASPVVTASNGNPTALSVTQNTSNPYQFQIQPKAASASPVTVTFSAPDTTGQGKPATTFAATFAPLLTPQVSCGNASCVEPGLSADSVSVTESGYSGGFTFANSAPTKCSIANSTATTAVITSTSSMGNACKITATDTSSRNGAAQLSFPSLLLQQVNGGTLSTNPVTVALNCAASPCTGTASWQVTSTNPSPAYSWIGSSIVLTAGSGIDACFAYNGGVYVVVAFYSASWALMPPNSTPPYQPSFFPYYYPPTRHDHATCQATLTDGFGGVLTVYVDITV